jgi:hypothetical protein
MNLGRCGQGCISLLLLVGAVGMLGAASGAQEPSLLNRATCIAPVKNHDVISDYCVWLSDHEVISVDYGGWRKPPVISFHDLKTGKTRHVAFIHWPMGTHTQVFCATDGRWALCLDADGPEPRRNVIGMDLQTGRTLSWPNLGDPYHLPNLWLSDSRR